MSDYGSRLRLEKSEKYMITGGDLHLTAGNTLYRVHRYFFERESPKFKEILGKPTSPGQPKPGSTPTSAILLEVTSEELDKFLWVFYNPTFSWDAPVEDWASILYLASLWRFPHVKAHALRELEQMTMPLIDKIALFQKCSLDEEYLVPLYGALCARDAPLSIAESEKLGVQTAVIVFQAREALRAHSSERGKSPLPEEVEDDEIVDTIRDILKGVPHSNRKSISLSGWVEIFLYQHEPTINGIFRGQAAAYEEALASRDVHGRTRRARRITREEFPSDPGMETITEKETEPPTTPKITEPPEPGSENSVDDSEGTDVPSKLNLFADSQAMFDAESKTLSWYTGQKTVFSEEPAEEPTDIEEVETRSVESFLKNQGTIAVAARTESRISRASRTDCNSSLCSTPPLPGAWPSSSS